MPTQRTPKVRAGKKKPVAKTGHKHRAAGTKKKAGSKKGLLSAIGKVGGTKKKAKEEKLIVSLDEQAENLLALQQAKADLAEAKGRVTEFEGLLIPEMEEHRIGLCQAKGKYIRSIGVRATGDDEDGNEIKAGQVTYGVQNRYTAFNPTDASTDEDVLEQVGEDATLRDEAVLSIANALEIEWDEAEELYEKSIEEVDVVSLKEGALDDPDVVEILQEHLLEWLQRSTKATPEDGFHERSHFNEQDAAIMEALQGIGLCRRAKGSVRASGAPKPTRRAVKTAK